jgi:Reverse transcriptase (RNA-dependent DNA polymerase)
MNKKPIKIDKRDYNRVILTETLPYETPLIFSSSGLYEQLICPTACSIKSTIISALITGDAHSKNYTIPIQYKVRKNSLEFRRLSLMHPRAQWRVKEFYQEYHSLIMHYCKISPASIRSPYKVASSYFRKSSWENIYQYRQDQLNVIAIDDIAKHSPSFYTYRGYDRLYKFYESKDFFDLEKKYANFWSLDVTKCFDSIYTHSLSWALKSKPFTKENVNITSTFGQKFDSLMQFSNHNETNGIPIGPEVSRIFAELIFQKIDKDTINKLSRQGKIYDVDYTLRRYVDDVFIFAKSVDTARNVYTTYVDTLLNYNLHHNPGKATQATRPFASSKSRLIHAASREINVFLSKFLYENITSGYLTPTPIKSKWNLTRSFVSSIRTLCSYNNVKYDDVSTYLISILVERIKKIVQIDSISDLQGETDFQNLYTDALIVIFDVVFFLYDASPSVNSSLKLCTAIILSIRFAEKYLPNKHELLSDRIYQLALVHLSEERLNDAREINNFVPLESLNLILVLKELGNHYDLPAEILNSLFDKRDNLTYFDLVTGLYYIGNSQKYSMLFEKLKDIIAETLSDLSDITTNSHKAYLFLDVMTCPYVDQNSKRKIIISFYKSRNLSAPKKLEINAFLVNSLSSFWNVSWQKVDLLNQLEKKELKQAY